jgi:signal transduction histidine kinase
MGTVFLLLKSSILIYAVYSYIDSSQYLSALFIVSLLIITALSFLTPVIRKKSAQLVITGLSLFIICCFFWMFPVLLLYLPALICELCLLMNIPAVVTLILNAAGIPLALTYDLESVYFLVLVCAIITILYGIVEKKLTAATQQVDSLRLSNQRLLKKIENGEALNSQMAYTAQLEERTRIAQELHDKIGHSLSGSLMQLEAIRLITATEPEKADQLLQRVLDTLRSGMDNIRTTLRNLKPPAEQMGINQLQLLIDTFKATNPIDIRFTHEGDISRIKPLVWKIFIDNTTEALTNITRHSKADQASLTIRVMNKLIRYEIRDNGHVLKPIQKGLGLAGMEERTLLVNGNLIVDNSNGFSITMLIPSEVS